MISKVKEFFLLTVGILIMVVGIYFFKFPNNFSFGGVTGIAIVVSEYLPVSRGVITTIINVALLIIGFLLLGKGFGIKTVYTSLLMSFGLSFLEKVCPMTHPLTDEVILELAFGIFLPACYHPFCSFSYSVNKRTEQRSEYNRKKWNHGDHPRCCFYRYVEAGDKYRCGEFLE